jgi:hypothetical protein
MRTQITIKSNFLLILTLGIDSLLSTFDFTLLLLLLLFNVVVVVVVGVVGVDGSSVCKVMSEPEIGEMMSSAFDVDFVRTNVVVVDDVDDDDVDDGSSSFNCDAKKIEIKDKTRAPEQLDSIILST